MASKVPARLSVLTLGTRDVPKLRAFYERLGWESNSPPGDEFAAFELGGAVLGLYRIDLLARDSNQTVPEPGWGGFTPAINVENEEDVQAAIDTARAAGAEVVAEPVKLDWGGVAAYFADPEGHVWEVAWLPGAEFDERGALIWPYGKD